MCVIGSVVYLDGNDTERRTGFHWEFNHDVSAYERVEKSAYDYED